MSKQTTRAIITVLTLITAVIHLVVLNLNGLQPLFILNGLGYLGLLGALLMGYPKAQDRLVHYAFMAYTVVTIVAWLVMNGDFSSILGVGTKAIEVALVAFLWMDL